MLLIIISVLIGLGFIGLFFLIITQLMKLAEDNSFDLEEAKGKMVHVYLRIPGKMSGKGKVLVSIRGSIHEIDAMTKEDEIPSNRLCKVARVIVEDNIVIIERFK